MKKHRYLGVLLVSVIFSMLICVNVYADNKCSEDTARTKYNPQITSDNSNVMISVKEGTFNVTVTGTKQISGSVNAGSPMIIPYNPEEGIKIDATLSTNDNGCEYNVVLSVDVAAKASKVLNRNYNGICAAFRDGTNYDKYFKGSIVKSVFTKFYYNSPTISEEYRNFYRTNLSYCFEENVSENLSEDLTKTLIVDSVNYISGLNAASSLSTSVQKDESFEKLWGSVPDSKSNRLTTGEAVDTITLKCNPFGFTKLSKDDLSKDDYYTNETKYRNIKTEVTKKTYNGKEVNACTKTCREVVTVKYGPPVASKAGLCFEYKVKIQSKMNCESKPNTGITPPTLPNVCNPVPVCNTYTGYTDQAGPSEEFDKCVNKCDGGKYSQSCINKCYKKVYKNKTVNLALNYEDYKSVKVRSGFDKYPVPSSEEIEKISSDLYLNNPGKFVWSNNQIIWKGKTDKTYNFKDYKGNNINLYALGKYYFNSVELTKRTLYGLRNQDYTIGTFTDNLGPYVIRDGGFKSAYNCKEECRWIGCSRDQSLDAKEAYTDYSNKLKEYTNLINSCTAEASCSTTESEFSISVNYSTDKEKNKTITFGKAKVSQGGILSGKNTDIILDKGGCFGESSNEYDYMTEWSFPGTWINNKSGEISYQEKTDKSWHKVKEKFCTPLNIVSVNTKWWDYKVNYVDKNSSCTLTGSSKKSILNEVNDNQNIKASVRDFGYWKWWNFDISCFYAVNNEPGDYSEENSSTECKIKDSCTGDDCKVDVNNVEFRPVESGDLFPGDGSTAELDIVGRETGFNWSSKATNLNNKDYEITPTALTKAIQERKNEIYLEKNENTYLDYRFVLDSKTINSIRSYNKGKSYSDYDGDTLDKNGITVYQSGLFRNNGNISGSALKLGTLGCNNQDGSTNNCEKFSDAIVEGNRR